MNIASAAGRVTPSALAARAAGLTREDDTIAEHIRHTVDLLLDRSRVLADQVTAGQTAVVACPTGWPTAASNSSPPAAC